MRILIWTVAGLVAALSSSLAWLACQLIAFGGRQAEDGISGLPLRAGAMEALAAVATTSSAAAEWIVAGLWLGTLIVIVVLGLVVDGSMPRKRSAHSAAQ